MQTAVTEFTLKTPIEQRIIHLLNQQDKKALRLIFEHYGNVLLNIIYRIIEDRSMSEDVLQHVLLKVWNNASSFDQNKAGLYSWLVAISRNAALDKRKTKDFKLSQASKSSVQVVTLENKPDHHNNLDKLMANQLLEQLPESYRCLIDMSFFEGYSHQEISNKLDIPLGTVKTRIRSALKHLRSYI